MVDPLAEKMGKWSPYVCAFNNPIRFIDVAGLVPFDHIFDTQGRLIATTKTGNNILVKTSNGLVNITNLPYSKQNNQLIANIAGYYGEQIGLKRGTVGVRPHKKGLAYVSGENVFLNNRGAKIDENLGNYNDLKNALGHEKSHIEKGHNKNDPYNLQHAEVYLDQFADNTFKKTTKKFKKGIITIFKMHIMLITFKEVQLKILLD